MKIGWTSKIFDPLLKQQSVNTSSEIPVLGSCDHANGGGRRGSSSHNGRVTTVPIAQQGVVSWARVCYL